METMLSRLAIYMLQAGVAFSLLYPPLAAWGDPYSWIGYFPSFFELLPLSAETQLHLFGGVEVILALWILSGWRIYIPSGMVAILLVAIVVFNVPQMPVLFRDLSIAAAAVALALFDYERTRKVSRPK